MSGSCSRSTVACVASRGRITGRVSQMAHPMTSFERLRGAQVVRFGRGENWPGTQCEHIVQINEVEPGTPNGCEDCLRIGSWWVHLRLCLTCGKVACCNDSPNRHSMRHFLDSS